jgi:hypothetical protein
MLGSVVLRVRGKAEGTAMKNRLLSGLLLGALALAGLPLFAHHAFDAEYDRNKQRDFDGIVTKVEWLNPHAHVHLNVKEPNGKIVNWDFELGSPNGLMRIGWSRTTLKIGDRIRCHASLAKDGSKLANASHLILANGTKMSAASSGDAN